MNTEQISEKASVDEVVKQMIDHLNKNKVTQASVAKVMDVNEGRFSSFLHRKSHGDEAEMMRKCIEFLNIRMQRNSLKKFDLKFSRTSHSQRILGVCNLVQVTRMMAIVYGPAGMGKTLTLKKFASSNTNVYYISAYHSINLYDMMKRIQIELKIGGKGLAGDRLQEIIEYMRGTDKVLLLDEFQHCTLRTLEAIRAIHDDAQIGIILSSSKELMERMTGKRRGDYDQIFSRITYKVELFPEVEKNDVKAILDNSEIKYDEKMLNFLYAQSRQHGHFRTLRNIIQNACILSITQQKKIDFEMLKEAKQMTISVSSKGG
jgi:hypothetical protein